MCKREEAFLETLIKRYHKFVSDLSINGLSIHIGHNANWEVTSVHEYRNPHKDNICTYPNVLYDYLCIEDENGNKQLM